MRKDIIYNGGCKENDIVWNKALITDTSGTVANVYNTIKTDTTNNVFFITSIKTKYGGAFDLNMLVQMIYKKEHLLIENSRADRHGHITRFSYKSKWIIFNPDYHKVISILKIIIIKNKNK